ncbi:acyl-CoA dehydrogenase [Angustibacter aerolatus]|uniref:Acyl-CoA dehydrogenase n=1 Tax=Angustibacter aerolatus TaxID=1162965 RepID=A0ABQ6JGU8_9ACTN|nr:acyl-CoA dehydrogenase [Angustibacter aerolatus]
MDDLTTALDTDLLLLDDQATDADRAVRDRVRGFVDGALLPVINDYWERAEFPFDLVPAFAALNVAGLAIEGYGCPGMSRLAAGLVSVELSRGDGSFNTFSGVHSGLAMGSIAMLGSEEQKQRWLPAMARLEQVGAFGLTEPDHGSDSVALSTTARRDGDSWVLDGRKRWIGNASWADLVIVWARDEADGQVKGFVVERPDGDPPGYSTTLITGKIGKRAVWQPDVVLDGVRVHDDNRLAECHSFKDVNRVLSATRAGAAWEALGHAIACYEIALTYAKRREQFGRPIAGFQAGADEGSPRCSPPSRTCSLLCYRMATLQETGRLTGPMASMSRRPPRGWPGRWRSTPETSWAATGCCSSTTSRGTSPTWRSSTPTRAPTTCRR